MAVMEQIGSRPLTGSAKGRRYAKRRTAKARRRQAKKLGADAPKQNRYTGYWD